MKTTLFSVASAAVVSLASTASAQSVLERVLGTVDNATNLSQVNGTYANIAESVGTVMMPVEVTTPAEESYNPVADPSMITVVTLYYDADDGPASSILYLDDVGSGPITIPREVNGATIDVSEDFTFSVSGLAPGSGDVRLYFVDGSYQDLTSDETSYRFTDNPVIEERMGNYAIADGDGSASFGATFLPLLVSTGGGTETVYVPVSVAIDGSITNIVTGIDGATQEALAGIDVSAIEWDMPTLDFGDMATTALGAVNTGDITLGVNSAIDEAAISTTRAISAVMGQIGGSADAGAIVLNVASNMNAVDGSINNALAQVNGTIGDLSTTALGAVNTGVIISGVDATVHGIVGMSGATNAALN